MAYLPLQLYTVSSPLYSAPSSFYSSFWCKKPSSLKWVSSWFFLVFPQLQVFSFNFYLNTEVFFFCALSNQYMHFQAFVFCFHLSIVRPTCKNQLVIHITLHWWPLAVWAAQSCSIHCNPKDCGPPAPLSMDSPGRILEYLPFPPPGDLSNPGIKLTSPPLLYHCTSWQAPTCSINL